MQSQLEEIARENSSSKLQSSVYASLKPEIRQSLSKEQGEFIYSLDRFEAPYLQEKLLVDEKFESVEEYQEAFTEFKKYIALIGLHNKKASMASEKVDEVWHQFILFTPQYHEFCRKMLGGYLHHVPKTSFAPVPLIHKQNLRGLYVKTFEDVSPLWNMDGLDPCDACGPDACAPDDYSPS